MIVKLKAKTSVNYIFCFTQWHVKINILPDRMYIEEIPIGRQESVVSLFSS